MDVSEEQAAERRKMQKVAEKMASEKASRLAELEKAKTDAMLKSASKKK